MQNYTPPVGALFEPTISQPQDVVDDVVVATVNPMTATLADNCSALYSAICAQALAAINPYQTWSASTDQAQIYGFGQNVGVIGIFNDANIAAFSPNPSGVSVVNLFTPATAPTAQSAFAQDANAMTVIGTSADASQTIWRSANGGLTWSSIAYPSAIGADQEVAVFWDKWTGDWYIFRGPGSYKVFRSTDDGLTWSLRSNTLPWGGTNRISVAFTDGAIFANTELASFNSTFVSLDNGATWSNAFAPAFRYVASVVEWNGAAYALGYDSADTAPYVASWNGSAWVEITVTFPSSTARYFTRFSTRVGPYVVALIIDTFGAASSTQSFWAFSRDGCQTWRFVPYFSANVQHSRYQAPSPGGIHVATLNAATPMTLARTELW